MTPTLPDVPQVESAIVDMTNAFRRENKLADVRPNATLAKAARAYADYLARSGTFSHTADGRQPADRAERAGYAFCQIAENLALNLDSRGFETRQLAAQAIEGWKNSPGHRKNMLAPHVVEIGVGVVRAPDRDPKFISVQLFGRPKSLSFSFEIKNTAGQAVAYRFAGERHDLAPRYSVKHTACLPDALSFEAAEGTRTTPKVRARYETRDGLVFLLKSGSGGTLDLDVSEAGASPASTVSQQR